MIAVCSDKGTIHVYNLSADEKKAENTTSWFKSLGKVVSYFDSEWSFASYKFTTEEVVPLTKCAFVNDNKLILISETGKYTVLEVNEEHKEIVLKEEKMMIDQE